MKTEPIMKPEPTYEELLQRIRLLEDQVASTRKIEAALKESQERYGRLSSNLRVVIYAAFPDKLTARFFASEQIEKLTGYPAVSFRRQSGLFAHLIHGDDLERVRQESRHALETQKFMELEYRIVTKDRQTRWIRDSASLVDAKSDTVRVEGLLEDITLRRQADAELQAATRHWQETFNAMSEALAILDDRYRILQCNRALQTITGKSEEEIIGRFAWEIVHGEPYAPARCACQRGSRMRETEIVELGRRIYEIAVDPQFDEQGAISGYVHIMSDITEPEMSRRALRDAQQTFLTVLDSIDATIYVADMQTHEILFMNRRMKKTFHGDFTGQKCWRAFREKEAPCTNCTNDQLVDDQGKPTGPCVWEGHSKYTGKWYVNYDRAIKWIDGRIVRLQVATDITQIKNLEQERQRTESQLRQAQKMEAIGTLAGGIAHDFNNILSAILGYSELALDDAENNRPSAKYIREIIKAGGRARDLVHQILTFSRQTETESKPIQVRPIVKEALKLLRASLPSTIEIQQRIKSNVIVEADPIQIHQVIMNLCTNAGHAMRDKGGVLYVGLTEETLSKEMAEAYHGLAPGSYLQIEVRDTGPGMSREIIDKIFDPYFTTKEKGEGTGMGLAVVQGIVQNCGGGLAVQSEPGKGAAFRIFLPSLQSVQPIEVQPVEIIPGGNERILFVDDEPPLVDLSKKILERHGYRVTIRNSGIEAIELFKNHPYEFDLVITDMTMPHVTGDVLAQRMLSIRPDIPIIICTGYSEKITPELLETLQIKALVLKPIIRNEILLTVRQVLDGIGEE